MTTVPDAADHPSARTGGEGGDHRQAAEPDAESSGGPPTSPAWRRPWAVVGGLTALVAGLPLAVAVGVLHQPRWYPLLDLAQTELRLRDVGTSHTPLVGLVGRFNLVDENGVSIQGSHPGPISFWALWPFYKLFGATGWAVKAATAALNLVAAGLTLWIGQRRGGTPLTLALAVGLAVVMRFYGTEWLTEAFNPYLPMLWWVVFLLAVWSVTCEDLPMLPVAVFAGTFCVQTHISYLGQVGGVGAALVLAAGVVLVVRRADPGLRRRALGWGGASLGLLVLLWLPPVIQQFTEDPGNLTILRSHFSDPDEAAVGLSDAVPVWLGHINPFTLLSPAGDAMVEASDEALPGLVLLLVWAAAALVTLRTWRRAEPRNRFVYGNERLTAHSRTQKGLGALVRLHMVVGVALLLGLVSISRILGELWYYLVLWAWGTTVLMLIAVGWTAVLLVGETRTVRWRTAGVGALAAVLVSATAFTWDSAHTEAPQARESQMVGELASATMAALRPGDLPGGGQDGRYLVSWKLQSDALGLGGQAYGFFLELDRQGWDVGALEQHEPGVVSHRVLDPGEATATLHYVVGQAGIDAWQNTPEATLVAEADLRTDGEVERFEELRQQVGQRLEAEGADDLVGFLDHSLFGLAIQDDLPDDLEDPVREMMQLGLPAAVFVTPPQVTDPATEA